MSVMPRHMRVVRWLDEQIKVIEEQMALGNDVDWTYYDMLIQTRQELQQLKEDNALYKLNFMSLRQAAEG